MVNAFEIGEVRQGMYIAVKVAPFETGTTVMAAVGAASTLYIKRYVPWRHTM